MKHLTSYKIFESIDIDLVKIESTLNDILLELKDLGYDVLVDVNYKDFESDDGHSVKIKIVSERKEELYSIWRQDREDYAKREYNKCSDVLERVDEFLKSVGLQSTIPYSSWDNLEYGIVTQGYDNTGTWQYVAVSRYEPKIS
jgi:hypothetical protein